MAYCALHKGYFPDKADCPYCTTAGSVGTNDEYCGPITGVWMPEEDSEGQHFIGTEEIKR